MPCLLCKFRLGDLSFSSVLDGDGIFHKLTLYPFSAGEKSREILAGSIAKIEGEG